MRKLLLDFFSNDAGIEVVGIFKSYLEITEYLKKQNSMVDCIILNLVFEERSLNVYVDLSKYFNNIIFISNIGLDKAIQLKEILGFANTKFLKYSGRLNLNDINNIKDEILEEVYKIKNKRIKSALFDIKKAIVIAASTGGPKVIEEILRAIKIKLDIPLFVVQHMPDGCTEHFVSRLIEMSNHKICVANNNQIIKSNTIYFAPSGFHMEVGMKNRIILNTNDYVNSVRPSADILFKSAADIYGKGLLAIVLTGMGKDGSDGVKKVKEMGGITIAQNERSSTVYGMPKSAIETGKIDMVLSVDKIVLEILKHSGKI